MELIPFFQQALIVVAIIFAIVLIMSYLYSAFIKKEKEEEPVKKNTSLTKTTQSQSEAKRKTMNYTSSIDAQKLYVNTEEHRKHVVTNKIASKPQRFTILNKTGEDE